MTTISAENVGTNALAMGFPRDQTALTRIIAIALRESGGNSGGPCDCSAHCLNCVPGVQEDSRGVWQINVNAWGTQLKAWGIDPNDLFNCVTNAHAMVKIYQGSGEAPWRGTEGVSQAAWDAAKQAAPKALAFKEQQPCNADGTCPDGWAKQVVDGKCICYNIYGGGGLPGIPNPFNVVKDVAGGLVAVANTFKHIFEWIQNPLTWKILGLTVAGGILLLFGLGLLAMDAFKKEAPSIAGTIARGMAE